jgi:hypothetical protein
MKHPVFLIALTGLLVLSGCMSLFHPQAETFYQEAKGATGPQTALRLISMMDTSAQQAKGESGESPGLHNLHDQFHALHKTFCDFSDRESATTAYEHSLTLRKELKTIFHRLWKVKHDASLRTIHLDLFLSRLQELRSALQSIPA